MSFASRYLTSFAHHTLTRVIGGHKNYEKQLQQYYSFNEFALKKRKIFNEIAQACHNHPLTYEEFLLLDQFGKHGYHNLHHFNGNTSTEETWARSALSFCQKNNIHHIIDFGAGDGSLALNILKEAKNAHYAITLHAVEMESKRLKQIRQRLKSKGFAASLGTFTTDIQEIILPATCLVVFSYSTDSMPPQLFINTTTKIHPPNALVGITQIDNKFLEIPFSDTDLAKKNISFRNTLYRNQKDLVFDLSSWHLAPMQRAWIPLPAMSLVSKVVKHIPLHSYILIIDEFAPSEKSTNTHHLCMPKDLTTYERKIPDFQALYKDTGEHLLYYPTYLTTYLSFCRQFGLTDLLWGADFAFAYYLVFGKKITVPFEDRWDCYGILGKKTNKPTSTIVLDGPWQKDPEKYHFDLH